MPAENLTRAEALERAAIVNVESYDVALNVMSGSETFTSSTTIRFQATAGASTFVDLVASRVHSVTLNGRALDVETTYADSRITVDHLAAQNELRVLADCAYTNTGQGLHRFVDPVDGEVYLYTQFEVPDSRQVFAVFEQPDLKATFAFQVTAPARWQVVSNQPTPVPEPCTVTGTDEPAAVWRFEPTARISSYITALVAGPYDVMRSELTSTDGRTIPLGAFCRKSLAEHFDPECIFDITRQGFAFFEQAFNQPYPFDKYDQLFVPEYNMGAMENAGCVTFTESYVFRSKVTDAMKERRVVTILHELAHMWFGDLVTMRWWNDLWLNESFAEYASTLATAEATEWHEAWTTFAAMEKAWAYRQDQLPSTHPIVAEINDLDDVLVNFDGITYAKGASVLKQLVAWVGREQFLAGVAAYFARHAWGNTELADLLTELETTSGRDLSAWSAAWLQTAGVNTLRPQIETGSPHPGTIGALRVQQSADPTHPTIRPHRVALGHYRMVDGAMVRTERAEFDIDGVTTDVTTALTTADGSPWTRSATSVLLLNDDDLTYAKVRFDDISATNAAHHLSAFADPLARSLVWGIFWDATRDGEYPASRYIDLVIDHIATETESTTLRTTLNQLILAARTYVDPARRMDTLTRVADALWQLARSAAPGSDAQFQFVTSFAQIPMTDTHAQVLRGLLDGTLRLAGLDIDTDLRWAILEGLVVLGAADEPEIEATLAQDATATGAQSAARARAAAPSATAKLATFNDLLTSAHIPNAMVAAATAGFQHVSDPSALSLVPDPYFAAVTTMWNERSYHIAETLIAGLYPAPLASTALRDATQKWLDTHGDVAPALRRLMVENLAGVERALDAQNADT